MSKYIDVKYGELCIVSPNLVQWKHHGCGWWDTVEALPWRRDPMQLVVIALERLHRAELKWRKKQSKITEIADFATQLNKDLERLDI